MGAERAIEQARLSYERAVFVGDLGGLAEAERELDRAEAGLALARGRILHARFLNERHEDPRELALFERATQLYRMLGDSTGEAESVFWLGCFHQVVRNDLDSALPLLEQAYDLATLAGDRYTRSEALRHLGIADHHAGRLDAARERLEEAARLRREIGLLAGAAADQVGLIYIAVAQGRRDDALALAEEAYATAEACGAQRIMRQVTEARSQIMAPDADRSETRD
ncbi:tetratricopeptide repeat protein [Sphaerisporangium krabiense]|uniref:Tetratricopeptide (TPR) repeat protein n=2 Tax=Sphaerisporangium krabiense TaxID=763782 RepID=A0A7W8Z941_9ACTN|nr:tetratricopeptide repeat protein [Sphaerisporangium krabiense]MBB5629689.1 tetratricopeptide (TPR) repeat protein [Sphaerisporangium krabiense]